MKIAIDVTALGVASHDKGGVYHHILYFLQAVKDIDRENTYILWFHFLRKSNTNRYKEACSLLNVNGNNNFRIVRSYLPNLRGWCFKLPVELFIGSVDIFHGPAHFVMPTIRGKSILTVHDIDFLKVPELLDPEWVRYKDKYTRISLKNADSVITVSKYMKTEIIRYFNYPEEKVHVVYNGVSPRFAPIENRLLIDSTIEKYNIKTPYILFVGTFHKNKNILTLLKAFNRLKLSSNLPHYLVLVGGKGQSHEEIIRAIEELGIEKMVFLPGFVATEDLPAIYNGSDLFVFPSLFEGFGIPVVEAMACGAPVISSNFTSLPEVVGEAGILIDPINVNLLAETMYKVLSDKNLSGALRRKGLERAKLFSWTNTAKETIAIYRKAYSS